MRRLLFIATIAGLLAAGCSSESSTEVGARFGVEDVEPATSSPQTELAGEGDEPIPGTRPVDADPWIEPTDALLRAEDVTGDWDGPTDSELGGYDTGPNQTDCAPYWVLESLAAARTASRLWFQPGANLDHDVYDTGRDDAAAVMAAAENLPDSCPVLTWLEGGTLSISSLPVDAPGVVAVEQISDYGERWWTAYVTRANLVSRLQWVHFDPDQQPSADAFREFEQLVAAMVDRLADAPAESVGADSPPDEPQFSTTLPPVTLPPVASTVPPHPPDDPIDEHPLAVALLDGTDVPDDMTVDETNLYEPGEPEDQRIAGCDASEAMVMMNELFEVERSFLFGDVGRLGFQAVGRASSADAAAVMVVMFGLIAECDPNLDEEFENMRFTGGPFADLAGATATSLEILDEDTFTIRFVAYQVGEVVGIVALGAPDSEAVPSVDLHRALAQTAVDRADL